MKSINSTEAIKRKGGAAAPKRKTAKHFWEFVSGRMALRGLTQKELANRAQLSEPLLSRLKNGTIVPRLRFVSPLALALNSDPALLFEDTVLLAAAAGFSVGGDYLEDLKVGSDRQVWLIWPRHRELSQGILDAILKFTTRVNCKLTVFASLQHAEQFWEPHPRPAVRTPASTMLDLPVPMLWIDPGRADSAAHRVAVVNDKLFLTRLPHRTLEAQNIEAEMAREFSFLNLVDLAALEEMEGGDDRTVVILYTEYFPEEGQRVEDKRVYQAVKMNQRRRVPYTYLVPTSDPQALQEAMISFTRVRDNLLRDEINVDDSTYRLRAVESHELARETAFILYARDLGSGPLFPKMLLREIEGLPMRFRPASRAETARFMRSVIEPDLVMREIARRPSASRE